MATKNIFIRPGVTKSLSFVWYTVDPNTKVKTPVNLTAYTAKMQFRKAPGDPVLMELSTSATVIGTTTSAASITLGATGEINITIPATVTAQYTTEKSFYDLLLYNGADVYEFMEGAVALKYGITT
jgi:hypothetical protein